MEQIADPANFQKAWERVKANRGAPGPDGITIDEFPEHVPKIWPELRQQLLEGTYKPGPARRKSIPKPDGSERHLGIPNVVDRLVQQAILLVLTPIFDPTFSESSFGFRPNRSAHEAIHLVQEHIRAGYRWCVDMDRHGRHGFGSDSRCAMFKRWSPVAIHPALPAKFFDTVQHDVLMNRVARRIRDKRLLRLIGNYLRAGVMVDTDFHPSNEGTMQGRHGRFVQRQRLLLRLSATNDAVAFQAASPHPCHLY